MKVAILYYSGAGNTKYIAKEIHKLVAKEGNTTNITQIFSGKEYGKEFDTLIVGFPIYDLTYPFLVKDAIEQLDGTGKKIALFCTKAFISVDAILDIANVAKRRGFTVIATRDFIMPSTDLLGVAAQKGSFFEKALKFFHTRKLHEKLEDFIEEIEYSQEIQPLKSKSYTFLANFIPHSWKESFHNQYTRFVPMFHSIESKCTQCMKCVKECPRNNITFNEKIIFGQSCDMCLHCLHHCPSNSIQIGEMTENTVRYKKVEIV
jgi:ferredoxin